MGKEILVFSGSWCNPCKTYKKKLDEKGIIYRVVDVDEEPELVSKYGIRNLPTTIVIENGVTTTPLRGVLSDSEIDNLK